MHRTGFRPRGRFGSFIVYQRRGRSGIAWRLRLLYDRVFLTSGPRRLARRLRRSLANALRSRYGRVEGSNGRDDA
jgi:hypothetical protein